MITKQNATEVSYNDFLLSFKETLKSAFYQRDNIEKFILSRGFPALVMRDIMATKPLSVAIPKEYGGRGTCARESLGLLAVSYTHLRAHETVLDLVCRLLLEK